MCMIALKHQSQESITVPLVDPFERSKYENRLYSMKWIFAIVTGKSTSMLTAGIGQKLQDLAYRVTASNRYYLNVNCGLLTSEKFCEILYLMVQNIILITWYQ